MLMSAGPLWRREKVGILRLSTNSVSVSDEERHSNHGNCPLVHLLFNIAHQTKCVLLSAAWIFFFPSQAFSYIHSVFFLSPLLSELCVGQLLRSCRAVCQMWPVINAALHSVTPINYVAHALACSKWPPRRVFSKRRWVFSVPLCCLISFHFAASTQGKIKGPMCCKIHITNIFQHFP